MGFQRNLTAGEIVDQLLQVRRITGRRITNVVFMGMGEPLLNYDAVMKAAEIFSLGPKVTARRITISTAGWVDGIKRLAGERSRVKLAVSLHSAVDETRRALMPVGQRFPLPVLEDSLLGYYRQTRRRITFEVIFFDGVNDTAPEVGALIRFARRVPCKINVIPFHSIAFAAPTGVGLIAPAVAENGGDRGTAAAGTPDRDGTQQCGGGYRRRVRTAGRQNRAGTGTPPQRHNHSSTLTIRYSNRHETHPVWPARRWQRNPGKAPLPGIQRAPHLHG